MRPAPAPLYTVTHTFVKMKSTRATRPPGFNTHAPPRASLCPLLAVPHFRVRQNSTPPHRTSRWRTVTRARRPLWTQPCHARSRSAHSRELSPVDSRSQLYAATHPRQLPFLSSADGRHPRLITACATCATQVQHRLIPLLRNRVEQSFPQCQLVQGLQPPAGCGRAWTRTVVSKRR